MVHLSCLYCGSAELNEKSSSVKNTKRFSCKSCFQDFIIRWVVSSSDLAKKVDLPQEDGETIICLHCESDKVQKNWILKGGGQRFKCLSCTRHFTRWGIRGTYDDDFKKRIAEFYVNRKISARKLSRKYNISTSTIVTWWKMFKTGMDFTGA